MSINCTFYEHQDFGGASRAYTLTNDWRYWWVKFGSDLGNEITSFRANAYGGRDGNVYGLTNRDFTGRFASLNMVEGWTCWWKNVGGDLNDDIESALLVNRDKDEFVLGLTDLIKEGFKTQLDEKLAGRDVRRNGDPTISAVFWPTYDPSRKFVRINQNLTVELDWWPDYDASISYDIYFYLASDTEVRAYVAWIHSWVEGGVYSDDIIDELHPQAVDAAGQIDTVLAEKLPLLTLVAAFRRKTFRQLYLLPGTEPAMPPPSTNFGRSGDSNEDCSLVLTFAT